jgi:hypothetical protein
MGNTQQSNQDAKDFFYKIGGVLEKGAGAFTSTIGAPGTLANALSNYINSPLGGITLPIIIIGGMFVASQVLSKRL